MWRRKHIENYLLDAEAISIVSKVSKEEIIEYCRVKFALDLSTNYVNQDEPQPFLDAEGKDIIEENLFSLESYYKINKFSIAECISKDNISKDILISINRINQFLA